LKHLTQYFSVLEYAEHIESLSARLQRMSLESLKQRTVADLADALRRSDMDAILVLFADFEALGLQSCHGYLEAARVLEEETRRLATAPSQDCIDAPFLLVDWPSNESCVNEERNEERHSSTLVVSYMVHAFELQRIKHESRVKVEREALERRLQWEAKRRNARESAQSRLSASRMMQCLGEVSESSRRVSVSLTYKHANKEEHLLQELCSLRVKRFQLVHTCIGILLTVLLLAYRLHQTFLDSIWYVTLADTACLCVRSGAPLFSPSAHIVASVGSTYAIAASRAFTRYVIPSSLECGCSLCRVLVDVSLVRWAARLLGVQGWLSSLLGVALVWPLSLEIMVSSDPIFLSILSLHGVTWLALFQYAKTLADTLSGSQVAVRYTWYLLGVSALALALMQDDTQLYSVTVLWQCISMYLYNSSAEAIKLLLTISLA
jgi:hypothetical protein